MNIANMNPAAPAPADPALANPSLKGAQSAADAAAARKAATAFEAIMLQKILKEALPGSGDASDNWRDVALGAVAGDLASSIPFGLERLVEKSA